MLRNKLGRLILKRIGNAMADKALVTRQLDNLNTGDLYNLSEAAFEASGNCAVFSISASLRICIVLWHEEYKPQTLSRRADAYNAAPMVMSDLGAYKCPITGVPITSRSKHRENLARHGCVVAEPETKRDNWQETKREDYERKKAIYDAMENHGFH